MKSLRQIVLFLLLLNVPLLYAQKTPIGYLLLPDSNIVLRPLSAADSVRPLSATLFALPGGTLRMKLILRNDRSWNNLAIDTTLHIPVADTLFLHSIPKPPSTRITFTSIALTRKAGPSFSTRHMLKPGLATLAVLSNWASFYLKRCADDRYRQYRRSSDVQKMDSYFRQTQKLDTISNVFLGISVASVSSFLFLLITAD